MTSIDNQFEAMNRLGSQKKPFLFAVDYELSELILIKEPLSQQEVLFDVRGVSNDVVVSTTDKGVARFRFSSSPITFEEYKKRFRIIRDALVRGDSFLANLTVSTPVQVDLSLPEVYLRAKALYKLCVPGRFVCFSPERFVCLKDGYISCNPMKGTIDASIPDAEAIILSDYKESAEHYTIVDLIRNDLSMVSKNVQVKRFRYIDRLKTNKGELLQVSSEIEGVLPDDWQAQIGSIIHKLLPAGSICGAPKEATVKAIAGAENEKRGFYTGVFGYFDGQSLDTGVMIRYIEQHPDGRMFYRSGGGITINSIAREEYDEVCEKVYLPF